MHLKNMQRNTQKVLHSIIDGGKILKKAERMNEKYEMAMTLARTYAWNAKVLKASGSEGWRQSLETAKKMAELAVSLKKEIDADKTVELKVA